MRDILAALEQRLRPLALRFCLIPVHEGGSGAASNSDLQELEYRVVSSPGERELRLDVCHLVTSRTVIAELWDPRDLLTMPTDARVDTVAIERRVWAYDSGDAQHDLVCEVVGLITAWMERYCQDDVGPDAVKC